MIEFSRTYPVGIPLGLFTQKMHNIGIRLYPVLWCLRLTLRLARKAHATWHATRVALSLKKRQTPNMWLVRSETQLHIAGKGQLGTVSAFADSCQQPTGCKIRGIYQGENTSNCLLACPLVPLMCAAHLAKVAWQGQTEQENKPMPKHISLHATKCNQGTVRSTSGSLRYLGLLPKAREPEVVSLYCCRQLMGGGGAGDA